MNSVPSWGAFLLFVIGRRSGRLIPLTRPQLSLDLDQSLLSIAKDNVTVAAVWGRLNGEDLQPAFPSESEKGVKL